MVIAAPDNLQRARLPGNLSYAPSSAFIPRPKPISLDPRTVEEIVQVVSAAQRPIILAERGLMQSGAKQEVLEIGKRCGALLDKMQGQPG